MTKQSDLVALRAERMCPTCMHDEDHEPACPRCAANGPCGTVFLAANVRVGDTGGDAAPVCAACGRDRSEGAAPLRLRDIAPAIRSSARFVEEHIAPRRCDSDGVADCWRCNTVFLSRTLEHVLADKAALDKAYLDDMRDRKEGTDD